MCLTDYQLCTWERKWYKQETNNFFKIKTSYSDLLSLAYRQYSLCKAGKLLGVFGFIPVPAGQREAFQRGILLYLARGEQLSLFAQYSIFSSCCCCLLFHVFNKDCELFGAGNDLLIYFTMYITFVKYSCLKTVNILNNMGSGNGNICFFYWKLRISESRLFSILPSGRNNALVTSRGCPEASRRT